ncbi:MAG: hypothetical protein ACRD3O_11560 [Terriglobia bacterium]
MTVQRESSARSRIPNLSKSRFMSGLQCHRRLYLELYEPELAAAPGDAGEGMIDVLRTLAGAGTCCTVPFSS